MNPHTVRYEYTIPGHGEASVFFYFHETSPSILVSCRGSGVMALPGDPDYGPPSIELANRFIECWLERYDDFDFEAARERGRKTVERLGLEETAKKLLGDEDRT